MLAIQSFARRYGVPPGSFPLGLATSAALPGLPLPGVLRGPAVDGRRGLPEDQLAGPVGLKQVGWVCGVAGETGVRDDAGEVPSGAIVAISRRDGRHRLQWRYTYRKIGRLSRGWFKKRLDHLVQRHVEELFHLALLAAA